MGPFRATAEYQIVSQCGANERSVRYSATRDDGLLVDLYVPTPELRQSDTWPHFARRIRLLLQLRHSGSRRLLDMELARSSPFVVLERVSDECLVASEFEVGITWHEVLKYAQVWCSALAEAHRLGIHHGAIHRRNFLSRGPRSWILDFSTLEERSGDRSRRSAHSPERTHGDVDAAQFEAGSPDDVALLAAALRELLAEPSLPPLQAYPELQQLLEACQHIDPDERPTALELSSRLRKFASADFDVAPVDRTLEFAQTACAVTQASGQPRIPERLGRFELLDKLGEGGMGTVYRARDTADGSLAAIKVLRSESLGSEESHRRFAKEARMLAQARNPYLANLLEFNEDSGVRYLAVEFVPGGTIARLLGQRGRLPVPAALALAGDAARGLAIAHRRGIVHRDLKPENMLLTSSGAEALDAAQANSSAIGPARGVEGRDATAPWLKLTDFGLARTAQQSESLAMTRDGSLMGTPLYMSPEQCRGAVVDARSDVYSLGATLFHFLAGAPPFVGAAPMEVIQKHCHEPPPSLSALIPDIPEPVAQVVAKCLAKNPHARYSNAEELLADLESLSHGEPTSLRLHPATPGDHGREPVEIGIVCDLTSSPAALWPYVSNTDRVNQALGLAAVRYTTRKTPERGVERFGEVRVAGQQLRWQEHPYEWVEGLRMSVLREFTQGPFYWFVNSVELMPVAGGGTRLVQTLRVVPRNWLGKWLARWELGRKMPRLFRRVYEGIDAYLVNGRQSSPDTPAFGRGPRLAPTRTALLRSRLDRLRNRRLDPHVVACLEQYLEHGSDLDVARIRPIAFAERFQLDPEAVVTACLLAAKEGVLTLLWDILCPSCRIPADVQESLVALRDHAYCPACDLKYELDFANSVELVFRAHPELRAVDTQTYCIGGPAFSAHVVLQVRMAAGERLALELALEEGVYRLRGPQLPFVVDCRVSPTALTTRWEVSLSAPPAAEAIPRLATGGQVVILHNNTAQAVQVRLERTAGKPLAFTAKAASSHSLFREMFPDQVLAPGQIVSVHTITFVYARLDQADRWYDELGDGPAFSRIQSELRFLEELIGQYRGAIVKTLGAGLLATFDAATDAAQLTIALLAAQAAGRETWRTVVHRGPALVTTLNGRLDYFGATPRDAWKLLDSAPPRQAYVTESVANDREVAQLARERSVVVAPADLSIAHGDRPSADQTVGHRVVEVFCWSYDPPLSGPSALGL